MPANIKGFRFEGSELVVDLELRFSFGINEVMPEQLKKRKTADAVEAQRQRQREYQKKYLAKLEAGKAKEDEVSEEKLQRMQKLQDKLKKIQEEMANAVPQRP